MNTNIAAGQKVGGGGVHCELAARRPFRRKTEDYSFESISILCTHHIVKDWIER